MLHQREIEMRITEKAAKLYSNFHKMHTLLLIAKAIHHYNKNAKNIMDAIN